MSSQSTQRRNKSKDKRKKYFNYKARFNLIDNQNPDLESDTRFGMLGNYYISVDKIQWKLESLECGEYIKKHIEE